MACGKCAHRRSCMVCEVCDAKFDSQDHKPLVLPCGHTFCKDCIDKLFPESDKHSSCAKCRTPITKCKLPVCYQLIPTHDSDSDNSDEDEKEHSEEVEEKQCELHNEKLTQWCGSCECQLCPECVHPRHDTCKITSIDSLMEEDSNVLLRALQVLPEDIDEFGDKLQDTSEEFARKAEVLDILIQSGSEALTSLQKEMNSLAVTKARLCFEFLSCESHAPLKRKKKRRVMQQCSRIFAMKESFKKYDDPWVENLYYFAEFFEITLKTTSGPIHTVKLLLPFFAANAQSLKLQLLDVFWQDTSGSFPDTSDDMLEFLLQCPDKSKLRHFMGSVTPQTLLRLMTVKLHTLGLHVHSHDFVDSISTVLYPLPAVLHLCMDRQMEAHLVPALADGLYKQCSLHLHFCDLHDCDIPWLCAVVTRLLPDGDRECRVQSIYLPRCQLTRDGLLTLLERLRSEVLCADVSCDNAALSSADMQFVSSEADKIKIKFNRGIEL